MKKAIFTVLLGDYDYLLPAPPYTDWDCILITDSDRPSYRGWTVIKVETDDPKKDSRRYKWLSHVFLPDYELVCYIDANMPLYRTPPEKPTWFKHPRRTSVFEEAKRIIELEKDNSEVVNKQIELYKEQGFPDEQGLYQNGYFVRQQNEAINRLHEVTYEVIKKFSYRDQIALPYAIWLTGTYPENIVSGRYFNRYAYLKPHKVKKEGVNVHHITPGRADKNLGKAVNDIVRNLPEEDWICLRDIDTVPAYHYTFFQQCQEIAERGEFDLVGCMSNRLGLKYQLYGGKISEETDFLKHIKIGEQLSNKFGSYVHPINQTIGGLFMLFPKKTWQTLGGFPEGAIRIKGKFVDFWFSYGALSKGLRIGLAQGIYLFHIYRMGKGNPRGNTAHLETTN